MNINDFLKVVNYHIAEGGKYGWECFGEHSYIYTVNEGEAEEVTINCVFSDVGKEIFMVDINNYETDKFYRWIHPDYVDYYKNECKKRGESFRIAFGDKDNSFEYIDLNTQNEVIAVIHSMLNGYDIDLNTDFTIRILESLASSIKEIADYEGPVSYTHLTLPTILRV